MNSQMKTWITLGVVSIISILIATSVFSVVAVESKDALRALVISVVLVSAVINGAVLLYQAVLKNNKDAMLRIGAIMGVYIVILLAFVYFDYKVAGSINLDKFDSRLRFVIVNAIWIPATFTALVFFYFYRKARELYNTIPLLVRLLEYVVGISAFIGSAWGTFDAVMLMTNGDWILAFVMAISIDAMLFIMGAWHLAANDPVTANVTLFGKLAYFAIALAAQMIDGALRTTGVTTDNYSQAGWTALPFVIIGSGLFIGITYLIDKYNGGVSFGEQRHPVTMAGGYTVTRPDSHVSGGQPRPPMQQGYQPAPPRLEQGQREGQYPPSGGTSVQSPRQGQQHGQSKFAEPGGLTEESVAALKWLGYSNRAIAGMRQTEADNRVANKVPPRPDQMSGNHPDYAKTHGGQVGNQGQKGNPANKGSANVGSNNQTSSITTNQRPTEEQTRHNVDAFSENGRDGDSNPH